MKLQARILSCARSVPAIAALLLVGNSASAQCPAPASWFPSSQTKPFDPASFPADASNCDFHQWAWQTFLWLTQDVGGKLRFTTFPSETELFDPKNPLKKPQKLAALMAKKRPPMILRVRAEKSKEGGVVNDISAVGQAGGGGILVDQKGHPVYYSVNFDPVFYEFVQSNQYYDYDKYIAAPPTTNFPLGAIELKASWRIVEPGDPSTANSYVTDALVPVLKQDPTTRTVTIDTTKPPAPAKVAFLGIHIVGIVANHPEFIWATFEQSQNSPDLPAGVKPTDNTPVSPNNFTFYAANTVASACNQYSKTKITLDPATQTFTPVTQVFRQIPQGGGSDSNVANIKALNDSVHSQLQAGEVWRNYELVGGVWLLPGALQPNMPTSKPFDLHGSVDLANTTMETFHQNLNCFTCHTTTGFNSPAGPIPPMNMNLSHILTDGLVTQKNAKLLKAKAAK